MVTTIIKDYRDAEHEILIDFSNKFKGKGNWKIICRVFSKKGNKIFYHYTTSSLFINCINDLKTNQEYSIKIQEYYFDRYFDRFKKDIKEWITDLLYN